MHPGGQASKLRGGVLLTLKDKAVTDDPQM